MRVQATSGWFAPFAFSVIAKRALVEPLRLAVLTLVSIHVGQVGEGLAHVGVVRTERLFL